MQVFPGADESSPSRAQYFSWINNTNEGATEAQTLANLEFFAWLRDEYGMRLDIYAFDAGAIDCARLYCSTDSERFNRRFPNGFDKVCHRAAELGVRLGVWGGPDGFGDTPESSAARRAMMVGLCRDHHFALFKFDTVCGFLRPEKEADFIQMMTECRQHSPDLILLDHRLGLPPAAAAHSTTFLWEGKESYIDSMTAANVSPAPHHRLNAMRRGLPPGMRRLTEDHGVCLSSCLDAWDDELVLQAFNRCLILAPEIYGNPWLLRDDEFPKLARLFNLHRRHRDILVNGFQLPEGQHGPHAVSRGDGQTRLITLRNLTWSPVVRHLRLDGGIGLEGGGEVELRQHHPTERILGRFAFGASVPVTVEPFRSCLLAASTTGFDEPGLEGVDYQVVKALDGEPLTLDLLGMPGSRHTVGAACAKAELDGHDVTDALAIGALEVVFPGQPLLKPTPRQLATLEAAELPADTEALYEATCFAADNNALEVRSLSRSGPTAIPQVQKARDMFFSQERFRERGVWDRQMFDGAADSSFYPCHYNGDQRIEGGALRLDLGRVERPDRLVLEVKDEFALAPLRLEEGNAVEVSLDLRTWRRVPFFVEKRSTIQLAPAVGVRYLRFPNFNVRVGSIEAFRGAVALDRGLWRASNLFGLPARMKFVKAWRGTVVVDEAAEGSQLCVALHGTHGVEGAYAAIKTGDGYVGAPDRAPSYPCNAWENVVTPRETGYTYFFPLAAGTLNRSLEIFVLGRARCSSELAAEVWLTRPDAPWRRRRLVLTPAATAPKRRA